MVTDEHAPTTPADWAKKSARQRGKPGDLREFVAHELPTNWGTPMVNHANGTRERFLERKRESVARGNSMGISCSDLNLQAENWASPAPSADTHSTTTHSASTDAPTARETAWPTPGANDYKGSAKKGQRRGQLDEAAEQKWQTPSDPKNTTRKQPNGTEREHLLASQAQHWQSPGAMGGDSTSRGGDRIGETLLSGQAESFLSTLPAPAPSSSGEPSSPSEQTSRRRLNPLFVEWLMGLPEGWTDYGRAATAFTLWWPRMRSALCGLVSNDTDVNQGSGLPPAPRELSRAGAPDPAT